MTLLGSLPLLPPVGTPGELLPCSAYNFLWPRLVDFHPLYSAQLCIQPKLRETPVLISGALCLHVPLRARLFHFSTMNILATSSPSNSGLGLLNSARLSRSAGNPLSALPPAQCRRRKARGTAGLTAFVLLLSRFSVLRCPRPVF